MFSLSIPFFRKNKIEIRDDRHNLDHEKIQQQSKKMVRIHINHATLAAFILLQIGIISWAAYATLFLFGDSVSLHLLAQQSDMKYEFEARISVLQSQLDSYESQAQNSSPDTTHNYSILIAKQAALETRHEFLESIVNKTNLLSMCTSDPIIRKSEDISRPHHHTQSALLDKKEATSKPPQDEASLKIAFKDFEAKQQHILSAVKTHTHHASVRVRDLLIVVGFEKARNIPFELSASLPDGVKLSFENQLTKTKRALSTFEEFQTIFKSMPLLSPMHETTRISSQFGLRKHPILGIQRLHAGLDYAAPEGHPISSPAAGTIVFAGTKGGYGNVIEINHGFGITTRYAHLAEIRVELGQKVASKAFIGTVGTTGLSTGAHLHYETRIDGEPQDPMKFITAHKRL